MTVNVSAEIHIQAARPTVWQAFADTSAWPQWHTQIGHAAWATDEPWRDNAVLSLQVTPVSVPLTLRAEIKTAVPESLVVWESRILGLTAVHVFEFSDSLGGCRVREKETFHGCLTPMMYLLQKRQEAAYARSLRNLKRYVESGHAPGLFPGS